MVVGSVAVLVGVGLWVVACLLGAEVTVLAVGPWTEPLRLVYLVDLLVQTPQPAKGETICLQRLAVAIQPNPNTVYWYRVQPPCLFKGSVM